MNLKVTQVHRKWRCSISYSSGNRTDWTSFSISIITMSLSCLAPFLIKLLPLFHRSLSTNIKLLQFVQLKAVKQIMVVCDLDEVVSNSQHFIWQMKVRRLYCTCVNVSYIVRGVGI